MTEIIARPPVAVIILNWYNAPDTIACLQSLNQSDAAECLIVVVDNGSTDSSVQMIEQYDSQVTILRTESNLGYAGGNNVGIRHALAAGAEAICILNNDVTVEPGFLAPLLTVLHESADTGVVTPLVAERTAQGGKVWALGSALYRQTAGVTRRHAGESVDAWRQQAALDVDIASGAAMLIKAEVFQRAGLLDESFFLYYEETDWCLKVRQAGYRIRAVPSSVVWHKVSASLGQASPIVDYYMLRNHLRLIGRHWQGLQRSYLLVRTVARDLAVIAAYTVKSHAGARSPHRNARLCALRDALRRRWGPMGPDVQAACRAAKR